MKWVSWITWDLINIDRSILGHADNVRCRRVVAHSPHLVLVLVERVNALHFLLVPDLDRAIGRAGHEVHIVRREGNAKHPWAVATESASHLGVLNVENFDVVVVRGRAQRLWVRREGERTDGHRVALERVKKLARLQVVNVNEAVNWATRQVATIRTLFISKRTQERYSHGWSLNVDFFHVEKNSRLAFTHIWDAHCEFSFHIKLFWSHCIS